MTVDIPIVRLDMDRRIRRFTPKARSILNVLPADIGRSIDDIKLNIDVPDLNAQIDEVIKTNVVKEAEVKDQNGRWHRMQIRPYTTTEHSIEGVILSLVDIHELKQLVAETEEARVEAERANSAKDDFLATLSHELRTPLSSMLLNAQRLRGTKALDVEALHRVGDALERATFQQMKLIEDLLDVSSIAAGKLTLDRRSMDLCATVRAALDNATPLFEAKSLALRVSVDLASDPIWADQGRVHQIVSNLLANAIRFTPAGGQVTVIVDAIPGYARLRVTDTGIGIEASFLPHVFAHFSQSDSSITRKYGGLGLGLALVQHLVQLHGGTVHADSAGVDQGSTFTVTLPLVAKLKAEVASSPEQARPLDRPGKTKRYEALVDLRVLFIDDDLRTREAVQEVLALTGAHVELAGSVAEGLAAVEASKPQVILCDIAMPEEDGYAFVRKLRAGEAGHGATIPALALTALASEDDKRRALAAGFQMHLAKPIDIDRLRDAVLELSKLVKE
jgi:two-component system CheB/CheR fusion protein